MLPARTTLLQKAMPYCATIYDALYDMVEKEIVVFVRID